MGQTKAGVAKARKTLAKRLGVPKEDVFHVLGKKGQKKRWLPEDKWKPPSQKRKGGKRPTGQWGMGL